MAAPLTFTGGMNVPAPLGRFNASIPLATLTIDDQHIRLHSWVAGPSGDFHANLDDIAAAFPLHSSFWAAGVGIRRRDGLVAYFWTLTQRDAVLGSLFDRGITIEPVQRARAITGLRDGEDNPVRPTGAGLLQLASLMVALLCSAVAIVLLVAAGSSTLRLFSASAWAISLAIAVMLWRNGRQRSP